MQEVKSWCITSVVFYILFENLDFFNVFWYTVIFLWVMSALNILLCNTCKSQVVIYHLYVTVQKARDNLFHFRSTTEVDVPDET